MKEATIPEKITRILVTGMDNMHIFSTIPDNHNPMSMKILKNKMRKEKKLPTRR